MTELNMAFISHFIINILSTTVLCYGCYYRVHKNANVAGSFILFGVGIFVITYLLHGVDMSMEFAFGLFAVFTMLRYRTDTISIKEMTYLFLVTAVALLTAVGLLPIAELLMLNGLICLIAYTVDCKLFRSRYALQSITYERIENIKPENHQKLIDDLTERTGLAVVNVTIVNIDFLRDTALLTISYLPSKEIIFASPTPNINPKKVVLR